MSTESPKLPDVKTYIPIGQQNYKDFKQKTSQQNAYVKGQHKQLLIQAKIYFMAKIHLRALARSLMLGEKSFFPRLVTQTNASQTTSFHDLLVQEKSTNGPVT